MNTGAYPWMVRYSCFYKYAIKYAMGAKEGPSWCPKTPRANPSFFSYVEAKRTSQVREI